MKMIRPLSASIGLLAVVGSIAGCAASPPSSKLAETFGLYEPAFHEGLRVEIKSGDVVHSGSGVWLGDGEVLTAFHMLYEPPYVIKETDTISVVYQGVRMAARPVFRGDLDGNNDLELLKITGSQIPTKLAGLEVPPVCPSLEPVNAPVYITAYDNIYKTFTSPLFPAAYKDRISSHGTIALVSHGVSGSPVFDYRARCLAGVISFGNYGQVPNSPAEKACVADTRQGKDPHLNSTCVVSAGTEFTDADAIRSFLTDAHKYLAEHPIN